MPRVSSKREQPEKPSSRRKHSGGMDLSVIDKAFGSFADLYGDVLRINQDTTQELIQLAYFDRRSELFTLLAEIDAKPQSEKTAKERNQAERRMDSVVLAVRILGDPNKREQYDQIRQGRLLSRRREKPSSLDAKEHHHRASFQESSPREQQQVREKPSSSSKRDKEKRWRKSKVERKEKENVVEYKNKKDSKHKSKSKSRDNLNDTLQTLDLTEEERDRSFLTEETDEERQDDTTVGATTIGDTTLGSATVDTYATGMDTYSSVISEDGNNDGLFCGGSKVVKKISREITGAFEDTVTSFDQVFNAFTLSDKDIRAVTKRIDKAKKQLDS